MFESNGLPVPLEPLTLKLCRGARVQTAMRAFRIIVPAVDCKYHPGFGHRVEDVHMQTRLPYGAVQARPLPILPGATGAM
jgi:hypothetical protein